MKLFVVDIEDLFQLLKLLFEILDISPADGFHHFLHYFLLAREKVQLCINFNIFSTKKNSDSNNN